MDTKSSIEQIEVHPTLDNTERENFSPWANKNRTPKPQENEGGKISL